MRKAVLASLVLLCVAFFLVSCGSDSKTPPPTAQTPAFAFLTEVSGMTGMFTPQKAFYDGSAFRSEAVIDSTTKQPVKGPFGSLFVSKDGKKATFDLYDDATTSFQINTANTDGTGQIQITHNSNDNEIPAFSPDASKIAFISFPSAGEAQVLVINADGGNEHAVPIPLTGGSVWHPTFSRDGSKILLNAWGYDSNNVWHDGLMGINAGGTNAQMLTDPYTGSCDCYDENAMYSEDGTKILFGRVDRTGTEISDIYIMNSDASNVTRLTNNGAINYDPMFVKGKIIFVSNLDNLTAPRASGFELYSMNLDGTGVTRLTNNSLYDGFSQEWYDFASPSLAHGTVLRMDHRHR
jgi:Tol biopolymer transport system component